MNRAIIRRIVTDKLFLAVAALYGLLTVGNYTVSLRAGLIWTGLLAGVLLLLAAALLWGDRQRVKFRAELVAVTAEADTRRYEHDLKMERLAQENDILEADSDRRLASIRSGDGDPGPSGLAHQIGARRTATHAESGRADREQRQARIAAYEARQLDA